MCIHTHYLPCFVCLYDILKTIIIMIVIIIVIIVILEEF